MSVFHDLPPSLYPRRVAGWLFALLVGAICLFVLAVVVVAVVFMANDVFHADWGRFYDDGSFFSLKTALGALLVAGFLGVVSAGLARH